MRSRLPISTLNRARPRWLTAIFGILALAIQSFIVQTHIHVPAANFVSVSPDGRAVAAAPATTAAIPNPGVTPRDKHPLDSDPSNCPLCQEMLQIGHFIAPASILPLFFVIANAVVFTGAMQGCRPSHDWQCRGPPRI